MTRRSHAPAHAHSTSRTIFAARLYPHRSLGQTGSRLLVLLAAVPCISGGLAFAIAGAWPVTGFLGLDVVALALALFFNHRAARAYEEVALWRDDLLIRKHASSGTIAEHRFNPFWTRLRVNRHDAIGVTRIAVAAKGRELAIGDFLNPPDRASFAAAFGAALSRAKSG